MQQGDEYQKVSCMSQDLEEYQDIIEQLKPMINEPEFNQVLAQVASHIPRQRRFLLKMELKRLARPCIRLIDLRDQVDGECRAYEYEGRIHYLDDTAIEVFERQVRSFGDYTVGVYEAVRNTENKFRLMYQKQSSDNPELQVTHSDKETLNVPLVRFDHFHHRREERMNYAVTVELFTEMNKSIQANSVDVSVSGLRVKVNKEHVFNPGERLTVQFRGLKGEYVFDKRMGLPYVVVNIDRTRKEQRLSLKRAPDTPVAAFDNWLEKFIHGNKRRYKVNMDNTLEAIRIKTYEQYYTPNFTSVPVYIEYVEGLYRPRYALANDCNKDIMYYWSDEQYNMRLGYLFSHDRIKQLLKKPAGEQETIVYAFNHVKDEKVYFYSATRDELIKRPGLANVFLAYGSRKASWRVYRAQITDMTLDQVHAPLSIPDSVSSTVRRQNQPPPPRLLARLKHLTHIALLTDITDEIGTQTYERLPLRRSDVANLRIFGHPRNRVPATVDMFRFKYHNQRKETRYQLRSKVLVKLDDMILEGASEDISVHGLKIELDTFFHQEQDVEVLLSFPALQKVTQKYELTNLPYVVRGLSLDRNVLHLQAVQNEHNNTAQRFFDELIRNNRSRLKAYREEEEIPGMGSALRNLYLSNVMNTAFLIKKDGIDFIPEAVASAAGLNRLNNLLTHDTEPGHFNLHFLYSAGEAGEDYIQYTLKHLKANSKPEMKEVMIAFDPGQTSLDLAIKSRFTSQFSDDKSRRQFILDALANGQFIAIKVFLARTGRPDTERLQAEINYVGSYAIHKSKLIEEQLWSIVGIGDLVDVTDEVLQRHQFSPQEIQANHSEPVPQNIRTGRIEQLLKA